MIPSEILLYNQKLNKVEQLTKADLKKYRKLEVYSSEVEAIALAEKILSEGQSALPLDKGWYDVQKAEDLESSGAITLVTGRKNFIQGAKALYTLAARLAAKKPPEYKLLFKLKHKANEVLKLSAEIALEDNPSVVIGEITIIRDMALLQAAISKAALSLDRIDNLFIDVATIKELLASTTNRSCQAMVVVAYYGTKRCANKLERIILDFAKAIALILLSCKEELWSREEVKEELPSPKETSEKHKLKENEASPDKPETAVSQDRNTANPLSLERKNKNTSSAASIDSLGVYAQSLQERLGNRKVVLVGGNDGWRKKMAMVFKNPMIIEGKNFEPAKLQEAALVIINTNEVGHAVTRKASGLAANDRIRYIYTGKYNIEAIAQDILSILEK